MLGRPFLRYTWSQDRTGKNNISSLLPTILPSSKIVERTGKQERSKNRTKSLNWLRFNEFGRGIERTSFALLTFQPCRTRLNVFANMYVSPTRSMPGSYPASPSLSTISLASSCSFVLVPSYHRATPESRTNNQVDVEQRTSFPFSLFLSLSFSSSISSCPFLISYLRFCPYMYVNHYGGCVCYRYIVHVFAWQYYSIPRIRELVILSLF